MVDQKEIERIMFDLIKEANRKALHAEASELGGI